MPTYDKEVANEIVKCRQNSRHRRGADGEHETDDFVIKDDGVYPVKGVGSTSPEFLDAVWRPACDLDGQEKPTWLQPSLPIPFTEKHLAAFFLHGNGWYVRDSFGAWEDGPDESVFDAMIQPDDDISSLVIPVVKKAVKAAFVAYRAAECVVGQFDNTLAYEAQKLDDAYCRVDVTLRTIDQRDAVRHAHKKANDVESAWRKRMVSQLLSVAILPLVDSHSVEQMPHVPAVAPTSDWPAPSQTHDESAPAQTTPKPDGTDQTEAAGGEDSKPLQRFAAQDNTILSEIKKQGFDPLTLPANLPGRPGVKSATRKALKGNKLFTGSTVFNKAWERLTEQRDIVIKA